LISIVIPTFNREQYLREAVQSVLAQTYDRWELLIVDDGSTDGTRAYLDTLTDQRIRSVSRNHGGNAASARNVAIGNVFGSHIAFLDSDDLWEPEKLALQIADLNAHPACRWGYTGFVCVDQRGQKIGGMNPPRGAAPRGWIFEDVLKRRVPIPATAAVVQRQLFESVGGFDESLRVGEDLDLWIKLAEASPATVVPKALVKMRRHPGNHRVGTLELLACRDRIYEQALGRAASPHLRWLCRRERVRMSLNIVAAARGTGHYAEARRALWIAFPQAGWHPSWYLAALKTWLVPWTPNWLLGLYRHLVS